MCPECSDDLQNGHFKGQATGETFRREGKTDIRIEDDNRAAFVAECKIWHGKSGLHGALDQLLGYLTWRDCKAALVMFNLNNAGFTELQTKLPAEMAEHPNVIDQMRDQKVGEWRFKVRSKEDNERFIILHVFLFNLYVVPKERK